MTTTHDDHRLPTTVRPTHYELVLEPDLDAATFGGTVDIDAIVVESTEQLVLNAAELEIGSATVTVGGRTLSAGVTTDEDAERLTLDVERLEPGPITISIGFTGTINDKLRGFYRSTFTDAEGVDHVIATTQFESTNARRAFPCWDEPAAKATFAVTIVHDAALLAVSSGPEVDATDLEDGRRRTRFGTTMLMSTYLLAFVVGPLEATDTVDVDGVPMRVIHPLGKGHLADFALDCGAFALRHFTEYFAIDYPGEKLDLVALPDFAFGAMENLGCVTFREALLLLDPDTATQPEQQRAADVINHEIAHMWFGDLVTMSWWNGIWLKEAFATFCEMHCTNAYRPDWKRWEDFGLSRTDAFDVDSLHNTRPIEFEVVSPADAEAMYDVLTYEKGAAVVRMLEQYLGEDTFRDGIRHYLSKHSYGNTETHDLWDAIEEVTGQPARRIMDSWIFQGGYPVVAISESEQPGCLHLHQRRVGYDDVDETTWSVPIVLASGDGDTRTRTPVLLDDAEATVEVGDVRWLTGNADASGFYRVELSPGLAARTIEHLPELSSVERYGLLDDAWASLLADRASANEILDLADALMPGETDLAVWRRTLGVLRSIDRHLLDDAQDRHRAWSIDRVGDALDRVGRTPGPDDSDHRLELRAALLETSGVFGDAGSIGAARELLDHPGDAARNAAAVRVVAANGTAEDFDEFVDRYDGAPTPQEQRRYMFALPAFPGDGANQRVLSLIEDERIRSQDAAFVLARALGNTDAAASTWTYIEQNWDQINERLPVNAISRMIEGVTTIGDPDVASAVDEFFEDNEVPQAGKTLFQHLERMRVTVALRARLRSQLP
ncbi:MAG: M1 family metallopeptidase [Actinomycetota bacterium]